MAGEWSEDGWGVGPWGGAEDASLSVVDVQAFRENVVRIELSQRAYLTGLLEPQDASRTDKWLVSPVGGVGYSGDAPRPVTVVSVAFSSEDEVGPASYGKFIDLVLDRPMTSYPAVYEVAWTEVYQEDLSASTSGTTQFDAAYRVLLAPTVESGKPSRDFANPQLASAARQAGVQDPADPYALGTFGVSDDGDYAFDEGLASLKKRVIRRLLTKPGAFAHLPDYGVGIPYEAKRLGTAAVLSRLATEAEVQIAREPDVEKVKVTTIVSPDTPNLVFFRIVVRQRVGKSVAFDVPFEKA